MTSEGFFEEVPGPELRIFKHLVEYGYADTAVVFIGELFDALLYSDRCPTGVDVRASIRGALMQIIDDNDGQKLLQWRKQYESDGQEFFVTVREYVKKCCQ